MKKNKNEYNSFDILAILTIGITIGVMVTVIAVAWEDIVNNGVLINDVSILGQFICEQEYGMDYKSFSNRELECQPVKIETTYEVIKIINPKENEE